MLRKILAGVTICLSVLAVFLILHISNDAAILNRYSHRYFIFLLIFLAGLGLIILAWFFSARIEEWIKKRRISFADISFSNFFEKHYTKLLLLVLIAHIVGVFIYFPPRMVFSSIPILQTDYANHFHQVSTVIEALNNFGKHWAYDPTFAAGYPIGTLFDVDMKFFEIVIYLLTKLGVGMVFAYNTLIVLLMTIIPVVLYLVCRNFNFSRTISFLIILSGTLLWHSDYNIFLFNTAGMVSFVFGVYWALLSVSLFYRYLISRKWLHYLALLLVLVLSLLIHILMPFLLVIPLSILYFLFFKKMDLKTHFLVLLSIPLSVLANSWWISSVLRFMHYRIPSSWWSTLTFPEFLRSISQAATNIGYILFILGLWGFYTLLSRNKPLALAGISSLIWFFLLGTLGSEIPLIKTLEPSRFLIPANIIALIAVVMAFYDLISQVDFHKFDLKKQFPIFLLPLLVTIQLVVPYYWFVGPCYFCDYKGFNDSLKPIVTWFNENTTKDARIAFSDESPDLPYTGARMAYFIDREFIGGPFSDMNLAHNYATFTDTTFFNIKLDDLTLEEVKSYTDLFNIKWLISTDEAISGYFYKFEPYLKVVKVFPGYRIITIFEVDRQADYILEGSGTVTAELNKITVHDAAAGVTILKYHWLETLAVSPDLPIEKYQVEGSPIGFIKVTNGDTKDFVIYNAYDVNPSLARRRLDKLGQYLDVFDLSYTR